MIKMMLGITDEEAIIKALTDNNGDMEKAMEVLITQFGGDYGDEE
jgi:NACalpha-BTF3-like transcription factor